MKLLGSIWLTAFVGIAGCSDAAPKRTAVSGTVRVGGKPLERGQVRFIPVEASGPDAGGAITDGKYTLTDTNGPVAGSCRVEIIGWRKTGKKHAPMGTPIDEEVQCVPPEFNKKSTQVREIKKGETNTFDFDIP